MKVGDMILKRSYKDLLHGIILSMGKYTWTIAWFDDIIKYEEKSEGDLIVFANNFRYYHALTTGSKTLDNLSGQ